ncbi:PAS domain S-box protein [Algibacter amylolyticus]|uniref:histidine kinase n=1 Tax=Algibacter amylolyticus TaxID=1608400 RepID=A0A5M7BC24_9FLAO|nr:PAS domain S-box protein [Algibacter amylolyticus]KAA5826240.1 PAS domain S-box protein [Algibacter amylolyticus]MBB5268442.1 PAS domain S-box-containing protein [Algibacter amylolyticus]TSJ80278.1 PAS domain S-box protein [Algibacter amylolyticus]
MFQQDKDITKVLLDAVSEGVIVVDEHQNIVETNDSANKMFGYAKGELIKQPLNILIPQNYHAGHGAHFNGFMKDKARRQMGHGRDLYGARKDGSVFPVEAGLNPFTVYGKGYVMALVIDISERKYMEQERNHLASIFQESLNEIYVFANDDLKFINVNYGAQKNIGYSLEELKTMTPVDIKPNFTESQFRQKLELLNDTKEEKIEFETVHQRKSGSTYPVNVHVQRSKLGDKDVFLAIILDITEQKNYTENLEKTVAVRTAELKTALATEKELNELKTKFLSMVSHEFKTPLSGILTSTKLLNKYKLTEQQDKREKHINTITEKVQYLNTILNDFLSIEKLEKGKINYKFATFKLSKVLNEVIYNANMLLKAGQKINYPENIDDISLYQDEKILELTLSNLIYNAIKYSSENTIIDIKISQNKTTTVFIVKDNGIGIPEKDQKNIFNRYFRAENALLIQGTGIGLNIVKDHLESLNGSITFKSKEHEGSTFTIELPNKAQQ